MENLAEFHIRARKRMNKLQPIMTSHLFPVLNERLLSLLRGLSAEEWGRVALPKWSVKDIAAHLLDTNLRRLSIARDGYWGEAFNGNTPEEFNAFLNKLNHDWVQASRRLSPHVLVALLDASGQELAVYMQALDPHGQAVFPVSWAGEERSENWFDVAREYTEKWHHQQQIREAVARPGIMTGELYGPVVATFMRVLPYTYRDLSVSPGTVINFRVTDEGGGDWSLIRNQQSWDLLSGLAPLPACSLEIPGDIAWKLFTKGLVRGNGLERIRITGNSALAQPALTATAIVG